MNPRILLTALLWSLSAALALGQAPTVEHIQQRRLEVPAGQYSGIAHVSEDVYAVVHDKSQGGGLHFFTLHFLEDGSIGTVTAFEADAGGVGGKDNEDVVYVPETGTLFVAAESDQSIREYTLDGRESGRKLRIPAALAACRANAGFEALAYRDGLFWTTTEAPLPAEKRPRMHRLQSFRLSDLQAGKHYWYQAQEPAVPEDQAGRAQAYVSGISAMTVLPDGRLAVLEREVYVPGSGLFAKLAGSFTENSIYLVDPAHCTAGILEKTLLTRFRTSALTLASLIFDVIENDKYRANGIYHITDEGVASWFDFAFAVGQICGNKCIVEPCMSDAFPQKATRPHFSVLDKAKVKADFGFTIPYWRDALQVCIDRIRSQE